MSWYKFTSSWCVRRCIQQQCRQKKSQIMNFHGHSGQKNWTSAEIRQTFLDFFKGQGHQHVPSSSVIPQKSDGTYFVTAGMNQFKPIFLGTVDPEHEMAKYRRVVNSQKCIRISGKHNDLSDVGRDTYHHTFFEMLGSWSFADYFKKEACAMAWKLLTEVYQLPKERLYVTYFGGNKDMHLEPDLECRDIWLDLGVEEDHILPCGASDNFWDMGDTGPCGPCTEIHYNSSNTSQAAHLVNTGHPKVVELWNLVFMQYDRQGDNNLLPLPARHVDTGMGLERLTATLQHKISNYDTDLFIPLFKVLEKNSKCGAYEGRLGADDIGGRDTAYRIIADHARMFTVAISDGIIPGKHELEGRLRHIIHQSLHQAIHVLQLQPGSLSELVSVTVNILGEAFPELNHNEAKVKEIIDVSERKYRELLLMGEETITKLVSKSGTKLLTGEILVDLLDGVGSKSGIPLNVSLAIATKLNIPTDVDGFHVIMEKRKLEQKETMATAVSDQKFSTQDLIYLRSHNVPTTLSEYKYEQIWAEQSGHVTVQLKHTEAGQVLALRLGKRFTDHVAEGNYCGLLVDKSPFYAESGGQLSDIGAWKSQNCVFEVGHVEELSGYVIHYGQVVRGNLIVGDTLHPDVNMDHRCGCAVNHSATHLLNHALRQIADDVQQQGSRVSSHKLLFDFSCSNAELPYKCLEVVTSKVNEMIRNNLEVHHGKIPLTQAKTIPTLTMMNNEVYPAMCRVVSVGVPVDELISEPDVGAEYSTELCGGCHVDCSGRIEEFVITHFHGLKQQGTKRVIAVTGDVAKAATANAKQLTASIDDLEESIKRDERPETWNNRLDTVEKLLFNDEEKILPKLIRDKLISRIDALKIEHINRMKTIQLQEELRQLLQASSTGYLVGQFSTPTPMKKVGSTMSKSTLELPVMMFSDTTKLTKHKKKSKQMNKSAIAVAYIPPEFTNKISPALRKKATACAWMAHLDSLSHGKRLTIGTLTEYKDHKLHYINLLIDKEHPVEYYIQLAKDYISDLKTE